MTKYFLGALQNTSDPRDWVAAAIPTAILPESAMKPCLLPHENQGAGNCVTQPMRTALQENYGKKYGVNYTYGAYRDDTAEGMYPRLCHQGVKDHGMPLYSDDGGDDLEVREVISYAQSAQTRLEPRMEAYKGWTYFSLTSIADVKAAIVAGLNIAGHRVDVTLRVCTYTTDKDGWWDCSRMTEGLHRVMILGYGVHNGKTGVKIRNSWGDTWGSGIFGGGGDGDAWVTWDDLMWSGVDAVVHIPPESNVTPDDPIIARRTLRLKTPRMSGDDVRAAQTRLVVHGYVLTIDGIFGNNTDIAVRKFQRDKSLIIDGIVGAKTWAALDAEPGKNDILAPMDTATAKALTQWLAIMVGDYYIIGGQGHRLTRDYLNAQYRDNPGYFTNGRYAWLQSEITRAEVLSKAIYCEDCSGLFMRANEAMGRSLIPVKDTTANGLWSAYCKEIPIDKAAPGDILFRGEDGKMAHMAIIGTDGVYEAAGTAYGVVRRDDRLDRRTYNRMTMVYDILHSWTHCGRLI